MSKNKIMLVASSVLSIIGFISVWNFESMAYWGNDTMIWFWTGAIFTYLCVFSSFYFIYLSNKKQKLNKFKVIAQLMISSFSIYTFIWTGLVVYVWYLKDFSF